MEILDLFYTKFAPIALFIIMVGLGISLTLTDLKRVFIYPKAATIGVIGQFIMLPVVAFALVEIFNPIGVIAVGIILLASSPSGVTSNTYTFAARGDVALSVTLTAISSLVTVFTIPFYAWLAMNLYMDEAVRPDVPVMQMVKSLAMMTVLPVTLGMLVRHFKEGFALRWIETIRKAALVMLVILIVGSIIISLKSVWDYFMDAAVVACLLNLITMSVAFGVSRFFGLNNAQVICLTYEVGVHNLGLALTVALAILQQPVMGLTALIYGIFAKTTSFLFMFYALKYMNNGKESAEENTNKLATETMDP